MRNLRRPCCVWQQKERSRILNAEPCPRCRRSRHERDRKRQTFRRRWSTDSIRSCRCVSICLQSTTRFTNFKLIQLQFKSLRIKSFFKLNSLLIPWRRWCFHRDSGRRRGSALRSLHVAASCREYQRQSDQRTCKRTEFLVAILLKNNQMYILR